MREQSRHAVICGMLTYMRIVLLICGLATAGTMMASDAYPPPRFTDPQRVTKLEAAMPEVDRILRAYATEKKIPGMVWGVVIDGRLAHTGTFGVRDRTSNAPATVGTAFRIASMTKSFTALAILRLRDEGKLSLEDPVATARAVAEVETVALRSRTARTIGDGALQPLGFERAPDWSGEDYVLYIRRQANSLPRQSPPSR